MGEMDASFMAWLENASARVAEGNLPWLFAAWVVVTAGGLFVYALVRAGFQAIHMRIAALQGTRIHAVRYRGQDLFSPQEVTLIILGLLRLVRNGVYAVIFYFYLTFAFGLFPATRGVAGTLLGYILSAMRQLGTAAIDYLPSLVFLLVLFFVTRGVIKLMALAFDRIWLGRVRLASFPSEFARPTFKIVRFCVIIFAIMVAYPYLPGSGSPAFQAVSIFLGVLVSLGSSGAIANIVSGIALTYMRAFSVGDRVRIADAEGDVTERNTFVTRVRTPKNVDITIPNAMVMSNHIINYSTHSSAGVVLHTTITIGYDVEWSRIHEVLIEAAKATTHIEEDPPPFVLQTRLDDFYVHYELNAYTRLPTQMASIYSELHQNIQDGLHGAGIEIASPHLAQHRDGNLPAIPDPYLPQDYESPGFRFLPIGPMRSG